MADGYDDWYGTRSENEKTPDTVACLADLAGGGAVLELAIGTGRVALPLAARGLAVSGIEGSPDMVAKLREKPGGADLPVVIGDMADCDIEGRFDLVYLIFNTLFNLQSQEAQVRCFKNVALHLTDRGVFVVEAFVPDLSGYGVEHQSVRTSHIGNGSTTIEASRHDPLTQKIDYHYVTLSGDGVHTFPCPMRYAWPNELDLMAQLAGLELRERWSDWRSSPFTADNRGHVSVYGRAK